MIDRHVAGDGDTQRARGASAEQGDLIEPWALPVAILRADSALYFLDACNRNPFAETADIKIAPTTRFWGAALQFVAAEGLCTAASRHG